MCVILYEYGLEVRSLQPACEYLAVGLWTHSMLPVFWSVCVPVLTCSWPVYTRVCLGARHQLLMEHSWSGVKKVCLISLKLGNFSSVSCNPPPFPAAELGSPNS